MSDDSVPTLLRLMFNEHAGAAHAAASPRLLAWARAFDDWLADRRRHNTPSVGSQALLSWRRLLAGCRKPPWQIEQADICSYIDRLRDQGLAPSTLTKHLVDVNSFYAWCAARRVDPLTGPGFNPAEAVPSPKNKAYANALCLSPDEAARLLHAVRSDPSVLARREYAFFLARLSLGVSHKSLLGLRWHQLEWDQDAQAAWVEFAAARTFRTQLPLVVWQAILDWLTRSGRLAGIQPQHYIFCPLADPLSYTGTARPEDWNPASPSQAQVMRRALKGYGRLAGIPASLLNLHTLRNTAAVLRLHAGDEARQIQEFTGLSSLAHTHEYIASLVESPAAAPASAPRVHRPWMPPRKPSPEPRNSHRYKEREMMTHGLYVRRQPPEQIAALLMENIEGLSEQIKGLQVLGRVLMDTMQAAQADEREQYGVDLRAVDVYARCASRLGELLQAEKELALRRGQDRDALARDFLNRLHERFGEGAPTPDWDARAGADLGSGLDEGIASVRLILRRTLRLALEADDTGERLRMSEIYIQVCWRLVRLLKLQHAGGGQLHLWLDGQLEAAMEEARRRLNIRLD